MHVVFPVLQCNSSLLSYHVYACTCLFRTAFYLLIYNLFIIKSV